MTTSKERHRAFHAGALAAFRGVRALLTARPEQPVLPIPKDPNWMSDLYQYPQRFSQPEPGTHDDAGQPAEGGVFIPKREDWKP